jgi:hypothetical protein
MGKKVQHLRCQEQLGTETEAAEIWHLERKADQPRALADINMIFILPADMLVRKVMTMKR